jgi:hypothetical protein
MIPEKYSPIPWSACNNGKCSCKQVYSHKVDAPVLEIISGEWGERYPNIRLVGDYSMEMKAEPFINMIPYGEIPEDIATGNAQLVCTAVNNFFDLVSIVEELSNHIEQTKEPYYIELVGRAQELLNKIRCKEEKKEDLPF